MISNVREESDAITRIIRQRIFALHTKYDMNHKMKFRFPSVTPDKHKGLVEITEITKQLKHSVGSLHHSTPVAENYYPPGFARRPKTLFLVKDHKAWQWKKDDRFTVKFF